MNYTDNIKGFRRRKVLIKLEHLLKEILYQIEYLEEELMYQDKYEGFEWEALDEDLEFWQENYSSTRTTYCLLARGSRVSRFDLHDCNEIIKMLHTVTI